MNIQQIKQAIAAKANISLPTLMLVQQKDTEGVVQPWLSHWDNDGRVRITMHDDVAKAINADKELNTLAYKHTTVAAEGDRAAYDRYVVIIPTSVAMTF